MAYPPQLVPQYQKIVDDQKDTLIKRQTEARTAQDQNFQMLQPIGPMRQSMPLTMATWSITEGFQRALM